MINFFRKIRKRLTDDNKPRKYFRYAVGEIFLVVIGILFALQINNWNTERKNRNRETNFVNQLAADLQNSTVDLKKLMISFSDNAIACSKVVHAFYKPSLQKEFNPMVFLDPLRNQRYIPMMGTANALVSSGNIDLIKSIKLLDAIVVYIEKTEALLMDVDRFEAFYFREGMEAIDSQIIILNLIAKYKRENNYKYSKDLTDLQRAFRPIPEDFEVIPFPVTVEELFNNKIILGAYSNLLLAHRNTYFRYKDMLKATEVLLQLIQSEGYSVKVENLSKSKALVFDSIDLQIIQKADSILSDETKWNKGDDRYCFDDIHNGRYSLFCALHKASVAVTGEYIHRRAVMQQIRFTIEKYEQDRVINHRLMDWNNHPETNFEELRQVLKEVKDSIELQLNTNK